MKENHSGRVIGLLVNTTAWIVGPVFVGTFFGRMLDQKYQTEPWLFLASVGVCFSISMFGLIKNALREFRIIEMGEKNSEKK